MDAEKSVTDRGQKRQNREFRSDITRRVANPVDLRMGEMKTVLIKVSCDGGDVALTPAPIVDVRLVDQPKANRDGQDPHQNCQLNRARHGSRLDKPLRQSQSSRGI